MLFRSHVLELIGVTQLLASHAAMIAKHHFGCRRPDTLDPTLMPMIPTPGHASLPSGHATENFAIATVLCALVRAAGGWFPDPDRVCALLMRQAERIAVNRTVAGVHFPVDSWAGATLGEAVAQVVLARCKGAGAVTAWDFDVAKITPTGATSVDFNLAALNGFWTAEGARLGAPTTLTTPGSPLAWLWGKALSELP
mgnify:CR=1 FL=1